MDTIPEFECRFLPILTDEQIAILRGTNLAGREEMARMREQSGIDPTVIYSDDSITIECDETNLAAIDTVTGLVIWQHQFYSDDNRQISAVYDYTRVQPEWDGYTLGLQEFAINFAQDGDGPIQPFAHEAECLFDLEARYKGSGTDIGSDRLLEVFPEGLENYYVLVCVC